MLHYLAAIPLPTDDLSAVERWAVFIAAIAAGVFALGAILRKMWRGFSRVRGWVREGIRRADALERLVRHELEPNSGGSLHDVVNANSQRLDRLEASMSTLAEANKHMWPAIEAVANARPDAPPERNDLT